jgi:hypothetical protein
MSTIGGVNLGNLTDYLFFFANGSADANWQGATKGFVGDVAVDGVQASERTSGTVPYAGTIYSNDSTLGAWQNIVNAPVNAGQAFSATGEVSRISALESDLTSAFAQINALPATPGYTSVSSTSLNGLNTQNGINEVFVINVTSGFSISSQINITGDPGDVFILRWDTDSNPANGYQGQVKFQSGGAIVPLGGLTPANFIHVAGDINASGGGTTPASPYPQGPRFNDGQGALINDGSDFSGGGFFTGYWLTTGDPTNGETQSLSNGIFVGGWYTSTTKFSMTSGTSGVYVSPNPITIGEPFIDVIKEVSLDHGVTWSDSNTAPGPFIQSGINPRFRFTVTNNGNETLTNVQVNDNIFGFIGSIVSLLPGVQQQFVITVPWTPGQHVNTATATGQYNNVTFTDSDLAHYFGEVSAIDVVKEVSPDNGITWFDANTSPGPNVVSPIAPQFRFTVTNTGNVTLTNVTVTDDVFGLIAVGGTLNPGQSAQGIVVGAWALGQQVNTATASGDYNGQTVTDTDPAYSFGVIDPTSSIDVEKEVSADNGVTWFDADAPTGPNVVFPTAPQFRFTVTNTGNLTLTNVIVTDNVYGVVIAPIPTLAPGSSATNIVAGVWTLGQQVNTSTATCNEGVSDTDPAYWVGVEAPTPEIDVLKEVSPDNGVNWFDANTAPGPNVPSNTNPHFRFTVINAGTVTLTNVSITDDVLGTIVSGLILSPGQSAQVIVIGTWALGQQLNTATASGIGNGQTITDTDPAYWVGIIVAIDIVKEVSPDNGVTWFDANTSPGPLLPSGVTPQFRYVVTNTGSVTLTNVTVTDNVYGPITLLSTTLLPGESTEAVITG